MPDPIHLSVLIPSIPRRQAKLAELLACLEAQSRPELEVLVFIDNCRRSVGRKRQDLTDTARGTFVCYIDDDELLAPQFVERVIDTIIKVEVQTPGVDVICYDAAVTLDDADPFRVIIEPGEPIGATPIEQVFLGADGKYADIRRPPWHWCAWRRCVANECQWPDKYWGDDWLWLTQAYCLARKAVKLDETLFYHRFSSKDSSGSHEFKDEPV